MVLDAEPGQTRDGALDGYRAGWRRWEERADWDVPPPPWPGGRLTSIAITVSDDVGTPYRRAWAEAGGMETEWRFMSTFLPGPPPDARSLSLNFSPPDGAPVTIDVALPSAQ